MAPPRRLLTLQAELRACTACPEVVGPVVHGAPMRSPVFLLGQAPGVHEGSKGKPFAWTAGKTLFQWFQRATGADEETIRARVYFSAVARCFPGKAKGGGGDRRPSPDEIERCRPFIQGEVGILKPRLVLPVGTLAIEQVLGHKGPLAEIIGEVRRATFHGVSVEVIALPHPSGASTWHRTEPGKARLARALELVASHEAMREALA